MKPTKPSDVTIKRLNDDEAVRAGVREIRGDEAGDIPANCFVVPVVQLDRPEPVTRRTVRKPSR